MIKKFLYFIIFFIFFAHAAHSEDVFKITSVNFDTSNSLIFLTSPSGSTEAIMKNVKLIKLQNPKRAYFDIDSAILTSPAQNWFFNSGSNGIKQVKVSQFSNNPAKVRIVLYLEEDFDQSKISFLRVDNNIVIKFKDDKYGEDYFQNTYRDERSSSKDFYENLSISNDTMSKNEIKPAVDTQNDAVINEIQQAFNVASPSSANVKPVSAVDSSSIQKDLKFKSKYYLNSVVMKPNGFLISGSGTVGVEKPMYLTNPARVVFDIPNAVVNPDIRNKEFKTNQAMVKIGQFEQNKARIVIASAELDKYFPIFSSDGQSILFADSETVDTADLFSRTDDAVSYYVKKTNSKTSEFIIAFNSPVVHSVKRTNSKLTMDFYNTLRYNDQTFKSTVANTDLSEMKIDLLPKVGLKLTLPLEKDSVVNCYLGADGRAVKIVVKNTKSKDSEIKEKCIRRPECSGKLLVVIDPGHGGSDYGAIRAGINEKDINLDISKRVQAILSSKGISVEMTRLNDAAVSLLDRTVFSENKCPDVFLSVHVNSSIKPEICGVETHYYHQESLELAQTVHSSMISYIKSKDRGLFKSKFYVINHTTVPAILVEIGFISNDAERAELVSEQRKQQTAKAIAEGILKYLNKK